MRNTFGPLSFFSIKKRKRPTTMFLLVLDFDNTIVDHSAKYKISVQPLLIDSKVSTNLQTVQSEKGWDSFVREVYRTLHRNGVTQEQILDCLGSTQLVPGFDDFIREAHGNGGEIIIISDSFTINVRHVLLVNGLMKHVRRIFSKPSHFSESGELVISDPDKSWGPCAISGRGICKGRVLESYIEQRRAEGVSFDFVAYAGDGNNDLCPMLRLHRAKDLVLPRKGFPIASTLKSEEIVSKVRARVFEWENGFEIIDVLRKKLMGGRKLCISCGMENSESEMCCEPKSICVRF